MSKKEEDKQAKGTQKMYCELLCLRNAGMSQSGTIFSLISH